MTDEHVYGPSRGPAPSAPSEHRSLNPRVIAGIVLAILAIVLVLQNTERGRIEVYFWDADLPVWLWLLGMLVVGFVLGSLFPWARRRRR